MKHFGEHLKHIRESRGMTVNQLAMYSGISSASISRYESGERNAPKPENIKKLAEALKIPYEELMEIAGHLEGKSPLAQYDPLSEAKKRLMKHLENINDPELIESLTHIAKNIINNRDR